MTRPLLVAALVAILVVGTALPLALADDGRRSTTSTPERSGDGGGHASERAGSAGGDHRPARTGAFTLSSGGQHIAGSFVSFDYTDASVSAFTVGGFPLFDATFGAGEPSGDHAQAEAHGAQVQIDAPSYQLQVHDNPEAVTQIESDGGITLTLASGVDATLVSGNLVNFTVGNLTGTARGEGLTLVGSTLTASHRVLLFVSAPHGSFDVHRADISAGVASGHVGVEASFNKPNGEIEQDVVNYGNVTMRTLKAEKGNLTLQVEGHGTEGRVLVLNIDGRVVGASKAEDLNVLFDNETALHAANLSDVLNVADGVHAEYYVVFDPGQDAFQLLVSVPHYSVHTLSVTTAIVLPPPSVIIGVVAGALILVPSALLLFRRR